MSDKYAALKQAAEKAQLESRDEWGYDTDAFHDEATPETVLELLAERDADKRLIGNLRLTLRRLRLENADWEARTLTVKLPPEVQGSNIPFAADGANAMRKEMVKALIEACAEDDISLKIEGE